jgi:hypothetical protein
MEPKRTLKIRHVIGVFCMLFYGLMQGPQANAQTAVTVPPFYNNVGGTANSFPLNSATNRVQWIFPPNSFGSAGSSGGTSVTSGAIYKIYFMIGSTASSSAVYKDFSLGLAQNEGTNTKFTTTSTWSTVTQVFYRSSMSITGASTGGWVEFELDKPFNYDPSKSLVFEMKVSSGTGNTVYQNSLDQRKYGASTASSPSSSGTGLLNFGVDVKGIYNDDAAVSGLVSPLAFCSGKQDISVQVANQGINQISGLKVGWSLDGVNQTPVTVSGTLDTFGGSGSRFTTVDLASGITFSVSGRTVKVWTYSPNGNTDNDLTNDTMTFLIRPSLSGALTVNSLGSGSTNFKTMQELADALVKYGVCGPVTVDVNPDTYTENVEFATIPGASSTNTITIDGTDSSKTIITNSSGVTMTLDNTSYLKFKNLTIENTGTSSSYAVLLTNSSDYNSFKNCVIQVPYATTSTVVPFQISGGTYTSYGNHGNYDTLSNCLISGGYSNTVILGTSSSTRSEGNAVIYCTLTDYYYYGLRGYYNQNNLFKGNTISVSSNSTTASYALYNYYSDSSIIEQNTIRTPYMGIYAYRDNGATIRNNIIIGNDKYSSGFYGLYIYYNDGSDVFHNTVYDISSYTSGYSMYFYGDENVNFVNNIMYKTSTARTHAYFYNMTNCYIDYNQYYNTGGNLINLQGTVYSDFSAYQAAMDVESPGNEQHSIFEDPHFKDLTLYSEDLHIDPKIMAPTGKWVGVQYDIDGESRCEFAPTIGADESSTGKTNTLVKFYLPKHVYANAFATVTNSAKEGEPKRHEWYINGVKVSDSVVLYTNKFSGPVDKLKLVTYSCAGKDSFEADVKVETPTAKPVTHFIASSNIIAQGETVKLFDLSTNGPTSWKWSISPEITYVNYTQTNRYEYMDGSPTTPNPVIRFDVAGKYKVCLTTGNGVGTNTPLCEVDYITVLPSINMGDVAVVNDSSGHLFDDGGPNKKYSDNENSSILIAPCASEVSIVFKKFDLECGGDFVRIYDGVDNNGTQLNFCKPTGFTGGTSSKSCSSYCPPSQFDTFTAKSGSMYIEFVSNSSSEYDGFEAEWWSKPDKNVKPPVADFDLPDSFCSGQPIQVKNTSTGESLQYMWELDNDPSTIESNDKDPFWVYFFPGTVKITLIAYNCGGYDTLTKEVTIFDPSKPKANFVADIALPTTSDIVTLNRIGKNCITGIRWEIFKGSDATVKPVFVNGTNGFSTSPQLQFSDTGCYTVKLYVENDQGVDSVLQACAIRVKNNYCTPSVANVIKDIGISEVVFNTINKTSSQGTEGYSNYIPTNSTTVEVGLAYDITVKRTSNSNAVTRTVWIDWNSDGDFADAGEKAAEDVNSKTMSWTAKINIPITARLGATVMRVAINIGTEDNIVCGQNLYGEYEDYRIYITTDKTPPVITLSGNDTITIEQGETFTDPGYSAMDNSDGNITKQVNINKYLNTNPSVTFDPLVPGMYYFDYTVKDRAGNEAEMQRRVVIVLQDHTAPVIDVALPDTVKEEVLSPLEIPELFSAFDLVDGDLTGNVVIDTSLVNMKKTGIYPVTYTVSDASANKAVVYRWIWVVDTQAPTLKLIGSPTVNHEVNVPYTDSGVVYSDNYDTQAELFSNLIVVNNVNITKPGIYSVTYSLTDNSGNGPVQVVRSVNISDNTNPVITLIGDSSITLEANTMLVDPGVKVSDNYDENLTVVKTGTFYPKFPSGFANDLGTFTIIYTVTDSAGNTASVTRNIKVIDDIAPVITLLGEPTAEVCRWKTYTDTGYVVSDNFWAKKDIDVTMEGSFTTMGTDLPGSRNLRYKAVDKSGNVSYSDWRTVFVLTPEECGTTGIQNADEKSVNVYPNPGTGLFFVNFSNGANKVQSIRIVNMMGQQLSNVQVNNINSNTLSFNLDGQAAGVYMIHITTPQGAIIKQVVLTK